MMNKVIAIKAWRRADYFDIMLSALEKCAGVKEYELYILLDGGHPKEQEEMEVRVKQSTLYKKVKRLKSLKKNVGCAETTRRVLKQAFTESPTDFVIHLEDDTIPAKDFLYFMQWGRKAFLDDSDFFSVSGYNRGTKPGVINKVHISNHFSCWGFGLFKRIWEEIINSEVGFFGASGPHTRDAHIFMDAAKDGEYNKKFYELCKVSGHGSWARPFNHYFRAGRNQIRPDVSRIQNIGETRGKWNPGGKWHRENQYTPQWYSNHPEKKITTTFKL